MAIIMINGYDMDSFDKVSVAIQLITDTFCLTPVIVNKNCKIKLRILRRVKSTDEDEEDL